jgi:hypothetical protein
MKNQKGFLIFPVIIIVGMIGGIVLMTAPDSVKVKVFQSVGLIKK